MMPLPTFSEKVIALLSQNPVLVLSQLCIVLLAGIVLFLIFYALRDILLRTHSFPYQFFCMLLVAVLPIAGFLLYLIVRPARTLVQRETDRKVSELWQQLCYRDDVPDDAPQIDRVTSVSSPSSSSSSL